MSNRRRHVIVDLGNGQSIRSDFDPTIGAAVLRSVEAVKAGREPDPLDMAAVMAWLDEQDARYGGIEQTP